MRMLKKSVLVTGGAGFIGSHLSEALVANGHEVTVIDNLSTGSLENLTSVKDHVEFLNADIRTEGFAKYLASRQFDTIFHLAANAYVPPSVEYPLFDFETNAVSTIKLLEILRGQQRRPTLIVMSSAAVYGNPTSIPVTEADATFPVSPYGAGKLAMERYVSVYSRIYGLRAAALRLFSVYGPRQRKQIVYDFMVKLSKDPNTLEIIGDGSQVRDLVFVEDVVSAALVVADRAQLEGEVYNVAGGLGYSTTEMADVIAAAWKLTPRYRYTGSIRAGDSEKWIASVDRLGALGFSPRFSFPEGVERTAKWFVTDRVRAATTLPADSVQGPHILRLDTVEAVTEGVSTLSGVQDER